MASLRSGDNRNPDRNRSVALPGDRRFGTVCLGVGFAAQLVWLVWRVTELPLHLVGVVVLATEMAALAAAAVIAAGLLRAGDPREHFLDDRRESRRFAHAVADIVGLTRSSDLRLEIRHLHRLFERRRPRRSAEFAVVAVLLEGPRRLVLVLALILGLLLGQAPLPVPPLVPLVAEAIGLVATSVGLVVVSRGRLRLGDRTRWSYSSIGEVLAAEDLEGFAPRRWVGAVATVAVMSVAIGLRGMSDRWTHGLAPMGDDERVLTMLLAISAVGGALFTLRTIQSPVVADTTNRSRRLEERTARQSAIGATVLVGLIGLLAGVFPGGVDAADDHPVGVEHTVESEGVSVRG